MISEEWYESAKAAAIGTTLECCVCRKSFVKTNYQQAFCSNKGPGNCKDAYWNARGPRQRKEQAAPKVDTEAELRELIRLALPFVMDGINARASALIEQPLTATQVSVRRDALEKAYALFNRMNQEDPGDNATHAELIGELVKALDVASKLAAERLSITEELHIRDLIAKARAVKP